MLWSSSEFGFISLPDDFATGSSIMPQKRNPDAAELVRAKLGRILGAFTGLAVVMKGLPLAYSKDMQEDKEGLFDAADDLALALGAMTGMVKDMKADTKRMRAAAEVGFATATDLADWLVQNLAMPFRAAHHVVGRLVKMAEAKGCDLSGLSLAEMQLVEKRLTRAVFRVLTLDYSVGSRRSFGGTAPANVRRAIAQARERFL